MTVFDDHGTVCYAVIVLMTVDNCVDECVDDCRCVDEGVMTVIVLMTMLIDVLGILC
jgi:hypothetical protein